MSLTPFHGTAFCDDAGNFAPDAESRERFMTWKQQAKGMELAYTIAPKSRKRTNPQLRWLFGVAYERIAAHAKDAGYEDEEIDKDQIHEDLLSIRFGTREVASLVTGTTRHVPAKRTSDLNTTEMGEFMEWVCRYGAQHIGVVIPLPDERDMEAA